MIDGRARAPPLPRRPPRPELISAGPWGETPNGCAVEQLLLLPAAPEVFSHEGHYFNGKGLLGGTWPRRNTAGGRFGDTAGAEGEEAAEL